LQKHGTIMDKYDPNKRVKLIVDEWGTWYDVEPNTNPGFLYQQNTLRDAFVAAITLNTFNKHADRVHMANLAQTVNVLQALILTEEDEMLLTPTYHVFDLYRPHMDATLLPTHLESEMVEAGSVKMEALNVSSSLSDDGTVNIAIANINPEKAIDLAVSLRGTNAKDVSGRYLTAPELNSHNSFEQKEVVSIKDFKDFKWSKDVLNVKVPAKSVIVLRVK